jgi:hypothetical protein
LRTLLLGSDVVRLTEPAFGPSLACDLILCLLLKEKEDVSAVAPLRFGDIASDRSLLSFRRGGQEVRSQATDGTALARTTL